MKVCPQTVTVRAGSRIHISLADLGLASRRTYGGVGFMVDRPASVVTVRHSNLNAVRGIDGLDEVARHEVQALLSNLTDEGRRSVSVDICDHAPQHVGLGSKTAIKLSIIAGFDRLLDTTRTREHQQLLSGRGGTSGIGIHGFYEGGVIWDAGRPCTEVAELLPSSAVAGPTALQMLRIPFPKQWHIGLALTPGPIICGAEEVRFVQERTPVSEYDALKTMSELYHGVLPSFKSADITALASALSDIASHGFKRHEIERCGHAAVSLLDELQRKRYACGISSVGPLLYVVLPKADLAAAEEVALTCKAFGSSWLGYYDGLNRPADIVIE